MKKVLAVTFTLATLFCLCSCGGEEAPISSATESGKKVSIAEEHLGTRSNPFTFGDEIIIEAKSSEGYAVIYTMRFDEIWGSGKVKNEYPNYIIEDRILARGEIQVSCNDSEDGISFDLMPIFITREMNEEGAQFQTYKPGNLDSFINTVYSGGKYDIIVLGSNDGIGSLETTYLKIDFKGTDDQDEDIWISLPKEFVNEVPIEESVSKETIQSADSKETEMTGESGDSSGETSEEAEMTAEELEEALLEQPVYVEKTSYIVQSEDYKALYPDMLQAVIKNNSGTDVKNAEVAFVAWDSNGFPVKIETKYSLGNSAYVVYCDYEDANMVNGGTYGESGGLSLASDTKNIATIKAIVVKYEDFDGNMWDNPLFDVWETVYSNKKLIG